MTEVERLIKEGFITEDFIKEEVRCDYFISSHIKKVWVIQLDLLAQLIKVCKDNNLRVWASYGTMIGAVRHRGYIPWDDDIDVFMPRDDYEKLLKLDPSVFPAPYHLQSVFSDSVYIPFARLRNSKTIEFEPQIESIIKTDKNGTKYNRGIFIDINPLDGVPSHKWLLQLRIREIKFLGIIHNAYVLNINPSWLAKVVHKILHLPFVPYNTRCSIKTINRVACRTKYKNAQKIGFFWIQPYAFIKQVWNKSDWDETIWMPFENIEIPVPKGYDIILRTTYGDYMKYPPVEERGHWHTFEYDPDTPAVKGEYF